MKPKTEPHLTIKGLAAEWDVSEKTVRRVVSRGEIESIRIGKQIRITRKAKDAYEKFRQT